METTGSNTRSVELCGNLFRHAHPPRVDHQLAYLVEVDRVESDVDPVVSHIRCARQHELAGLGGHYALAFFPGEADAHHRLVARERDEHQTPDPELDLVTHHHLVGAGQPGGDAPDVVDGDHLGDASPGL